MAACACSCDAYSTMPQPCVIMSVISWLVGEWVVRCDAVMRRRGGAAEPLIHI